MVNLIKYEFIRKWRILGIFLAITLVLNAFIDIRLFYSTYSVQEQMGIVGAFLGAILGEFFVLYIIDVTLMYSRDLRHKSGYMFFLTPNSGFKILGAKVITGILEGFLFLAIFFLLIAINFFGIYGDPLSSLLNGEIITLITSHLHLGGGGLIPFLATNLFTMFVSIVTIILTIYAALSIGKSILAGKKYGGLISFIVFLLLCWLNCKISAIIFALIFKTGLQVQGIPSYSYLTTQMLIQIVLGIILFTLSAYLLEKKMDI